MSERLSDEKWQKLIARLGDGDEAKRVHAALRLSRADADASRTRLALAPLLGGDGPAAALAGWVLERLAGDARGLNRQVTSPGRLYGTTFSVTFDAISFVR